MQSYMYMLTVTDLSPNWNVSRQNPIRLWVQSKSLDGYQGQSLDGYSIEANIHRGSLVNLTISLILFFFFLSQQKIDLSLFVQNNAEQMLESLFYQTARVVNRWNQLPTETAEAPRPAVSIFRRKLRSLPDGLEGLTTKQPSNQVGLYMYTYVTGY